MIASPMNRLSNGLTLSLAFGGLCPDGRVLAPAEDPPASPASVALVFEDVRVIGMTSAAIASGRTVIIADGRVVAIGDRTLPRPEGSVVIQGRGRYLLPSLIDMHVHLRTADAGAYLHAGITTARNMWGWSGLQELISRIERGELAGPRIVSASPGLDGEPVQWPGTRVVLTPEQASAAVRDQLESGWRWIKAYTRLSRASYQAVMAEAGSAGLRVVGHVPLAVPIEEAIALGQHSIEHLSGYDVRFSRTHRAGTWGWTDADPALYGGLARLSAEAGVWNTPTLAIYAVLARQHPAAELDRIVQARRAFVLELARANAPLLAGSDAGIDVVAPGTSLHEELAELVAAGLTPYQALRSATIDAGRFLGIAGLGTLTEGAPADLLLVEGNPLDRIDRLKNFTGLVHRGAWIPR